MKKTLYPTLALLRVLAVLASIWAGSIAGAGAQTALAVAKFTDRTTANATTGELVTFRIQYQFTSTTGGGGNIRVLDTLDPNFELVSITGSIHTNSENYDPVAHRVQFMMTNPLSSGASGEVLVQVRFKPGTPDGTVATNEAQMSGTGYPSATSNAVTVTSTVSSSGGGPTYVQGPYMNKSGGGDIELPWGRVRYYLDHGNDGGPGEDLFNYVVEDVFPAGFKLTNLYSGRFYGTSQPVNAFYQTNSSGGWQAWPGNPRFNTGSGSWMNPSELALGAAEYVTGFRFEYGTLPGGAGFHHTNHGTIQIYLELVDPSTAVPGTVFSNCAGATADGESDTDCQDATVVAPGPDFRFYDWISVGSAPFNNGEIFRVWPEDRVGR